MYLTFLKSDNAMLPLLLTYAKKFGKDGNSKACTLRSYPLSRFLLLSDTAEKLLPLLL